MRLLVFFIEKRHQSSADCMKQTRNRVRMHSQKQQQQVQNVFFKVSGVAIENLQEFWYIGRVLERHDDDASAI